VKVEEIKPRLWTTVVQRIEGQEAISAMEYLLDLKSEDCTGVNRTTLYRLLFSIESLDQHPQHKNAFMANCHIRDRSGKKDGERHEE
jgi:hypothetical protein